MRKYVDENLLNCIKNNDTFPQDVDFNKYIYLHFGKIGLTVIKLINSGEYFKHINFWQDKTAEEINNELNRIDWKKEV